MLLIYYTDTTWSWLNMLPKFVTKFNISWPLLKHRVKPSLKNRERRIGPYYGHIFCRVSDFTKAGYCVSSMSPRGPCVLGGGVQCTTAPSQTAIQLTAPSRGREEERLRGEGDINPMSYIKRNTIRVMERWDALKWMITDSLKITAA